MNLSVRSSPGLPCSRTPRPGPAATGASRLLVLLALVVAGHGVAWGDELPLYELGIGPAGISTPHYLGANQNHNLLGPIPYLVYRGEHLRIDRSGVKTFLVDEERFDLNISAGASLPVDSDDNRARRGMDDLDLLLEIGPTLRYTPWQSADGARQLRLDLPLRGAFSADGLDLDYQGLASSPGVTYFGALGEWRWAASYAALFGDRRYHGYVYDVEVADATAWRPAYRASAGYTASRMTLSATRHYRHWYLGGYLRYHSLHGAANDDSPLVRSQGNLSAGFLAIWFFKQSEARVSRHPEVGF